MSNVNGRHDDNAVVTALFVQQGSVTTVAPGQIDQTTGRILVDASGGGSVAGALQTDIFVSTNGQTVFTATKTIAAMIYVSVQGAVQTPSNVDPSGYYTATSSTVTFSSGQIVGSIVILCYATS